MGTTLTGTTPQDTYDSLIKVTDNGPLSGTAKYLSDGLGNDSALAVSTAAVGIGTASPNAPLEVQADSGGTSIRVKGRAAANSGTIRFFNNASSTQLAKIESSDNSFEIGSVNNVYAAFLTNGTERVRIDATGNVGIGTSSPTQKLSVVNGSIFTSRTDSSENIIISDGTTNSSIQQVTHLYLNSGGNSATFGDVIFRTKNSYTEMARFTSNGLCFNGDIAAANALDDYEEGTWTPSLIFSGGSTGITYTTQAGKYVKIGSKVSVNCYVVLSNKGSSTGSARIDGLPFTVPNAAGNYSPAIVLLDGGITYTGQAQGFANINSTSVALGNVTEAGSATALTDTNFSNSSAIMISLTYLVS